MHFYKIGIALVACAHGVLSAVNDSCSSGKGVCITTANCEKMGGTYENGLCPNDPEDVKCCKKSSCTVNGKTGVCKFTSDCKGTSLPGVCPGPSDFQCCVDDSTTGVGTSCSYQGLTGTCKNVSNCNGFRVKGLCPGPADVQCCLPKHSCMDSGKSGVCIPTDQCDGYNVTGKCPGGKDIKCCIGGGGGTSCSYQGLTGTCKNVSNCNGFRVRGLCPGPADVQCCLPKHSCSSGGKSGQCIPTGQCNGDTVTGKCPGGKDIKCCLGGNGGGGGSVDCVDHHTISSAAVAIAWETKAKGNGNDGTSLYIKVKDAIFPNDPYYQSCDRGVATAVRWSGADDNFPVGDTRKQDSYLSSSSLWTFVGKYDQNYSKLKPGDIVITTPSRRGTNHGHIVLYVGNDAITKRYPNSNAEFVSASYQDRSPGCGDNKSTYIGDGYHIYRYNGSYKGSDYYAYAVCTNDSISCNYNGKSGQCMYTSECNKIKGTYYSGLCPGPNDFKCCISSSSSNSSKSSSNKCAAQNGTCMNPNNCSGKILNKLCPGGEDNKCCVPIEKQSIYQANTQNSNKEITCSVLGGKCVSVSSCKGKVYGGYCSTGQSDIQCCVDKGEAIYEKALSFVNSEKWAKDKDRQCAKYEYVYFMEGENKCNLFVYEVLLYVDIEIGTPNEAGYEFKIERLNLWLQGKTVRPPCAIDWYNKKVESFKFIGEGDTGIQKCIRGDIITDGQHVAIVSMGKKTISASSEKIVENDWGFRGNEVRPVRVFRYNL